MLIVAIAPARGEAATYQMNVKSAAEAGDKCVSVPNGPFVEGMRVLLWDCNNMLAQTLVYDDQTRQLKFGASCVEVLGQGRAQDAIGVGTCNGAETQRWRMIPDKDNYRVVGVNDLCLDISNGVPANGTPLDVATCTPNKVVELWRLYEASGPAAVQSQPAPTSSGAGPAAPNSAAAQATGPTMPDNCQQNLNQCSLKIWGRNSFPHRGYQQSAKFSNGMTLTCTSNGPDTPRSCALK
jgi:Ricin-type beta-trefoil lectin domain